MKRTALLLLAAAVVAVLWGWSLPPRPRALAVPAGLPPAARGAIHIHTRRSDGSGTPEQIAAAAARAGLQFIVLTDHDTAASEPTRPYYHGGVLIIEASEISTDQGHIVALGLPRSPYPLGGEARDVLEDIARLGGFSIAAHPGSRKPELQWREWTSRFDGLEWINGDSEWRDETVPGLLRAVFTYPFRTSGTLAALLDRPDPIMRRWDELTTRRRVVAVAAADAHARVGLLGGEPDDRSLGLHLPSYEALFRAFSIAVSPITMTGDARRDAEAVMEGIREGHVYSSIDALAAPAAMAFTAHAGKASHSSGDIVPGARQIELRVESTAPGDARVILLKNGEELASAAGGRLQQTVGGERAVYRAEVHLPGAPGQPPVPWMISNPIYVGLPRSERPPSRPPASTFMPIYENGRPPDWMAAASPRSQSVLDVVPAAGGTQLSMRFGLGGTLSESPYAALVAPADSGISRYDRLTFTARADRPMRLSVQLRVPTSAEGERWHRSVYLDETGREITVFFDEMTPRGPTSQPTPNLPLVHAVMFVVDTVNTRPGAAGQIWIDDVKYGRE